MPGGHLQTLGGYLLRPRASVHLRRERIDTPDGDFLDLDFAEVGQTTWGEENASAPIAVVLHGLEGSSRALPAQQAFRALAAQGIRPLGLNFRSCSGEPNRTARFYHAGDTADLAFVLDLLIARYPQVRIGIVGYSLGGNVLLKYLGERGEALRGRVGAAAAFSVPFDLVAGARKLERGVGPLYASVFLRSLRPKYQAREAELAQRCDDARARSARSLWVFDDAVTAPLHGFRDAEEYYTTSSSAGFLSHIRVPTLLLHAVDDPFLPRESIPRQVVAENPYLTAAFTRRGGHVGFVSGARPWAPKFWAEREAARFLALHLAAAEVSAAASTR